MPNQETPVAISFSGGKSSLWMIHAATRGIIARPERLAVVFSDTGLEHDWTYEEVEHTAEYCRQEGIAFLRAGREQKLDEHLLTIKTGATRLDHPPLHIAKDGGGAGQAAHRCTREFKVAPMRRAVTTWLKQIGAKKRVTKWIGFAADESGRATKAVAKHAQELDDDGRPFLQFDESDFPNKDVAWERLDFPAIRLQVTREQQRADLMRWIGRAPDFSMCTICPWKTPARWNATTEAQRKRVYEIDEAIRDSSALGLTDGLAFLSNRLIPVERLIKRGDPTPNADKIDAGCDGGYCFL